MQRRVADQTPAPYLGAMVDIPSDPDILVIGAGAAGLSAGRRLAQAGASFAILEARSRVGGRARTIMVEGGFPVDLGCGWLHSADRNPLVDVARSLNVAIDHSAAAWEKPADARTFPPDEQRAYRAAWAAFYERLDAAADGPDGPAAALLDRGSPWSPMIDAGSTFINGVELDRLSIVDYGRYADSGVNWRAPIGYGALFERIGAGLPIALDAPVSRIDHSGARIRVETPRGAFSARAVIASVPPTLIAAEAIRFVPALPEKSEAASHLPLGADDKLFLAVEGAEDLPLETRLYGRRDRVEMASYHSRPFGRPLIECYFGGRFARALEAEGRQAFADYAIGDLVHAFGADMRRRLKPVACSSWSRDPFALGSYSYAEVGHSDDRAILAAPVDGRLFFAGEATSRHDFSTAHGAFLTGLAAAESALANLGAGAR